MDHPVDQEEQLMDGWKVITRYLSESLRNYISSSRSPLKGIVVLCCGPTFEIEESRKDLEMLMDR